MLVPPTWYMRITTFSISHKILLWTVPAVLVSITASVWLNNHYQEEVMMRQAQSSAETFAEITRESLVSMMTTNYEVDERFLRGVHAIQGLDSFRLALNDLRLRPDLMTRTCT